MTDNKQEEWVDNRSLYPTMTILELYDYFRANFINIGPETLSEMIVQGKFPFAYGLAPDAKHKQRRLLIFRAGAQRWLDEQTGCDTLKTQGGKAQ
ncbi:hypothetical protein [uncultured Gemmiger sp.]|uniref:hypothetical protein n=1 Tax=uncultured Gemmiger sp. TaxID=1623490 RepID=UPI00205DFE6A|nr:hypothetical protein [uncultured Gemmiger sp.]DAH98821.1 MAG TPA: Pyocin activator protein PrtN [Caudoviricetes sp.]